MTIKERKKADAQAIFWVGVSGLFVAALLMTSCAGTWNQRLGKAFETAHLSAKSVASVAKDVCKPVLKTCIAEEKNPCDMLLQCQAARDTAFRALQTVQVAVRDGLLSIDTRDEAAAINYLVIATRAMKAASDIMRIWGVR